MCGFLSGCTKRASVEEHRVRAVTASYNQALPGVYATKALEPLDGIATEDEIGRLYSIILGLSQRGLILDSRQESFHAESLEIPAADAAELVSTEVWWYRHVNPDTNAVAQAPRRVHYKIRYQLIRMKERWLVNRLNLLESRNLPLGE